MCIRDRVSTQSTWAGYTGNLCFGCKNVMDAKTGKIVNYGKASNGVCVVCDSMGLLDVVKGFLLTFSKLFLLMWALRRQSMVNEKIIMGADRVRVSMHSIMIKILTTYYQVIGIILQFPFEGMIESDDQGNFLLATIRFLKNTSEKQAGFSWDCLLGRMISTLSETLSNQLSAREPRYGNQHNISAI
eukprot:TRINITY_DN5555_c0_g1_i3.p1 TRINITY_DN5555_c0_g1~~TRINITY_DN5555_c0_g1_i3.p1  ORF type:complete len:211 (+),score=24.66 TRINITY_DN5555_c0_g1_i3:74-634(+)